MTGTAVPGVHGAYSVHPVDILFVLGDGTPDNAGEIAHIGADRRRARADVQLEATSATVLKADVAISLGVVPGGYSMSAGSNVGALARKTHTA